MPRRQVVQHADPQALAQQRLDQVRADEPGPSGHQCPFGLAHRGLSPCRGSGPDDRGLRLDDAPGRVAGVDDQRRVLGDPAPSRRPNGR